MVEEPDRIRDDIEATRASLSRDVDRLADRTIPTRVAQRRWTAVKERARGVSDRVMGTTGYETGSVRDTARSAAGAVQDAAQQAGARAGEAAGSVAETVREAPQMAARRTRGNPIAAGVIAFGAGLLAASLIPTTEAERRAGQQVRDNAGDLVDQVREPLAQSARELREDLSGSVRDAAGQVRDTATDAAKATADEAGRSARDAAEQTRAAARNAG
jgi:hypothetical protein